MSAIIYNSVRFILKPWKPKREIFHFVFSKAITQTAVNRMIFQLRKHLQEEKPKVLMLSINSAYGDMIQAQIAADAFKQAAKTLDAPLYTFIDDYALGPAYYVASCGTRVYANPFSLLGEVQSCRRQIGFQNIIDKYKIKYEQAGRQNILLDAFTKVTEQQHDFLSQEMQTEINTMIEQIYHNRSEKIKDVNTLKNDVFTAKQAFENGLVDEIATFDQVVDQHYPKHKFRELTIFKDDQAQVLIQGQLHLAIETLLNKLEMSGEITNLAAINDVQDKIVNTMSQALQNTDFQNEARDLIMDYLNDYIINCNK